MKVYPIINLSDTERLQLQALVAIIVCVFYPQIGAFLIGKAISQSPAILVDFIMKLTNILIWGWAMIYFLAPLIADWKIHEQENQEKKMGRL